MPIAPRQTETETSILREPDPGAAERSVLRRGRPHRPGVLHPVRRLREIWLKYGYPPLFLASLPWVAVEESNGAPAPDWQGLVELGTEAKLALLVPGGTTVRYRLAVPPKTIFLASVALAHNRQSTGGAAEFVLAVQDCNETLRSTWKRTITAGHPEGWSEFRASLAPFEGREVILSLSVLSLAQGDSEATPLWGEPSLRPRRRVREFAALARAYAALFGLRRATAKLIELISRPPFDSSDDYRRWCERHFPTARELARQQIKSRRRPGPVISLLLPVGGTETHLSETVESVRRQSYPHWQLCIADYGLPQDIRGALQQEVKRDPRIVFMDADSADAALGAALNGAAGEWIAPLGCGDELAPHALYTVAATFGKETRVDMIYSDEDRISAEGRRCAPFFKPDWSPDYFVSSGYMRRLSVYRHETVMGAGGFRPHLGEAQEFDLVLRIADRGGQIAHIEDVLYHLDSGGGQEDGGLLPSSPGECLAAATEHFARIGLEATCAEHRQPGLLSIRHGLRERPLISIVIPTGGREHLVGERRLDLVLNCIRSIFERSTYANLEVLCIDDFNLRPETQAGLNALHETRLRLLSYPRPLNIADKMNWGAERARGHQLVFLNDDIEVLTPDWLEAMLEFSQQPEIGAVGAKLLFPSGAIQHGGMAVADRQPVLLHRWYPRSHPGYFGNLLVPINCSSLIGACLMTRRDVFAQAGGFDEGMPFLWHDLDYCFKVRRNRLRVILTPYAELYHFETASKPATFRSSDSVRMARVWKEELGRDPYYNRNLRQDRADFRVTG